MAGTLELSEKLCWMPAGWVYDNALEQISEQLSSALKERLLESLTDVNGGYLNLQNASADEIRCVMLALRAVIDKTFKAGPSAMHNPAFFDGYLQQLRELDTMLASRLNELQL